MDFKLELLLPLTTNVSILLDKPFSAETQILDTRNAERLESVEEIRGNLGFALLHIIVSPATFILTREHQALQPLVTFSMSKFLWETATHSFTFKYQICSSSKKKCLSYMDMTK